ncbi:MAG: isoleucine--tRNA ligase [Oscillospiraceae bacterium]|nr:isoleucine--tRNA ligase [Oscillospiraceae bacterium]
MSFNEKFDFIKMEHDILNFWESENCFEKLREKNRENKRFRFIDGPITANNAMGIHHAWGRTIKDIFLRYKALNGFDCRYQNGFDAQGLWVEVEVEKDLGFKTKKDIEDYGMDRFTQKCVERVEKFSGIITDQSKRLGQWMDWENSYFTHTDENIQGIWHFLKVCGEKGCIERKHRPMPWCPRCGTSLSEHEMTGSYQMMTHNSVFFKLPLIKSAAGGTDSPNPLIPNPYILAWTTTPWTLSSNVALAVNPETDYAEVKIKSGETLYLAKNAIKYLGGDKQEVVRVFKGSELVGLEYETCFPEFESQKGITHKIVPWEDVAADEGTGVVHIAPGCGIEDFELGEKLGLPGPMPVDDSGIFLDGFGFMTGKDSHDIAYEVFAELAKRGKMYKTEAHGHSYPVCWRCKAEVIFRLVQTWYIKTEELKPALIGAAESVKWEPESSGKRMTDWLNNMGDWNISRKRYYGLPLPFYPCEKCGKLTIIGSKDDLRGLAADPAAVDALPELHRPWIDDIKIKCPGCGAEVSRISETGDVWLDAGIVPFSTLGYFKDKDEWRKNYPAEWITEMREQIRLWFYSMLFMSVVLEDRAPYERVLSYNAVVAEDGSKFSKTGYNIKFDEAAEQLGSDAIRYMFAGAPVASDIRFGYSLGGEARRKLLSLWNIFTFFDTYADIDKPDLTGCEPDISAMTPTDKWLVLRTNEFIGKAGEYMEDYKAYLLVRDFEQFTDDVSNWYIRTNRRRFWKEGDSKDKLAAYWTLYYAVSALAICLAPVIPFMTEFIWQNLVRKVDKNAAESVHLSSWPVKFEGVGQGSVLEDTALARDVIATAMRLRNERQIKVRQPLAALYLCVPAELRDKILVYEKNIKEELNIKDIIFINDVAELEENYLTVNFKAAGAVLKQEVNKLKSALENLAKDDMQACVSIVKQREALKIEGFDIPLGPVLFVLNKRTKDGIVSALFGGDNTLALDVALTNDLLAEGAARDIVRQCQLIRKEAGYAVEQRVKMAICAEDGFILAAINGRRERMADELLAGELIINGGLEGDLSKEIEINGNAVSITVAKI